MVSKLHSSTFSRLVTAAEELNRPGEHRLASIGMYWVDLGVRSGPGSVEFYGQQKQDDLELTSVTTRFHKQSQPNG